MSQMILATTVIAIGLGFCQWCSPSLVAGVTGIVTLAGLALVTVFGQSKPILQLACLASGLAYVVTSIVSLVTF